MLSDAQSPASSAAASRKSDVASRKSPAAIRKCEHCGRSLAGKRSDARFCSNSHRVMHRLRGRPEPRAATWNDLQHDERTNRLYDELHHWTDIGGNG